MIQCQSRTQQKGCLSATITGLTSKVESYVVTLNESSKCYECNVTYLRPRNGLVRNTETPAITPAQTTEPNHAVEHFLPNDVLPQAEATMATMTITEPAFPLRTVAAVAELPEVKAVPPRCEMAAHSDVKKTEPLQ